MDGYQEDDTGHGAMNAFSPIVSPSSQQVADRFLQAYRGNRRGSLQIMQEVNLHQFPYHHNDAEVAASPLAVPSSPLGAAIAPTASAAVTTSTGLTTNTPSYLPQQLASAAPFFLDATSQQQQQHPSSSSSLDTTSILEARNNASMRRAARELLHVSSNRSKRSIIDPRPSVDQSNSILFFDNNGDEGDDGDSDGLYEYWHQEDIDNNDNHQHRHLEEERQALLVDDDPGDGGSSNMTFSQYGSVHSSDRPQEKASWIPPLTTTNNNINHNIPTSDIKALSGDEHDGAEHTSGEKKPPPSPTSNYSYLVQSFVQQASSVAVVGILNMMIAIPFGASYFPIGWRSAGEATSGDSSSSGGEEDDDVDGIFPLPGKEALGLRMFLFATMIGQLVFAFKSKFVNAVGLQMVENVPFLHALAFTVIQRQGYGIETLSTLFFLFGLSSVIVGIVFYLLGRLQLGKVVYFFPNHVLVGCIGGIGVFISLTAIEVTTNATFDLLDGDSWKGLVENFRLLRVVLAFESTLRLLMWATQDKHGRPKFQLLSPLFYIMITPIFYFCLWVGGISIDQARETGYFFPSPAKDGGDGASVGIFNDPHMWDIFTLIDFSTISWMAVLESTGTMIALAAFSLIHVPINIPAFAISTDVETDMNAELIAHGWSNGISGAFGGLQNYMTYSNSVLYAKTGGRGLISSLAIVVLTACLFVVGPSICDFLPRCMAGTLLLHIGIDLTLEGVYDSIGQYDHLEYAGIWLITIAMTVWGMTAALITGIIAALSTYAVQSINYHNPIRQILTATTLRSSAWTRCAKARAILDNNRTGRNRILIFQLQGHVRICECFVHLHELIGTATHLQYFNRFLI